MSMTATSTVSPSPDPKKVFSGSHGDAGGTVKVKSVFEQYKTTKAAAVHRKTGRPVRDERGEECTLPSELEHAKLGAIAKHIARRAGVLNEPLTEHEKSVLMETISNDTWCGKIGDSFYKEIRDPAFVKATLLDDSTSGGLEIVPISADANIVTFPLLHSQLFPFIDLQNVSRGRRIEGASMGNVTINSGGGDDTAITPFDATSLVAAIDTTIFVADMAIECGRDFLSDSIVDVGSILGTNIGAAYSKWLDDQICNGDGATEPEGIFVKSGLTTITPDNTTSGPPTMSDYFDLMFGVQKQYRDQSAMGCCFISNDTTYARSRGIAIDTATPTTDQRPVFGLEAVNSYMTIDWPHRIQNNIPNGRAAFGALKKYRLYRRSGMELRFEQGGRTLALANKVLIVARARQGGKVMDVNAFAKWTSGQS